MSEDFNAQNGDSSISTGVSVEEVTNRSIHLKDSLIEIIRDNARLLSKSEIKLLKRLEVGDVSFSELTLFLQDFLVRLKDLHKISESYVLRYDSTWELSYGKYPEDGYGLVEVEGLLTGVSSTEMKSSGGFLAPLLHSSLITSLSEFIGIGVKPTLVLFSTVAITLLLISGTLVANLYGSKMNHPGGGSSVVVSSSSSSSVSKSKSSTTSTSSSSSSSSSLSSSSSSSSSSSEVPSSSSEGGTPSSSPTTSTVASAEVPTTVVGSVDSGSSAPAVSTAGTTPVDTVNTSAGASSTTNTGSRGTLSSSTVSISGELPVPSTDTGTVDTGSTDVPVEVPPADTGSEVPVANSEDTSTSSTTTNGSSE